MRPIFWKFLSLMLFIACLGLFVVGKFPQRFRDKFYPVPAPIKSQYWNDRTSLFAKLDCKEKIVFVGNSITDKCEWSELLNRNDIVNRGIGGDFSKGVYLRSKPYMEQKPKAVFLEIGINDIVNGVPADSTIYYINKTIDLAEKNKVAMYLYSVIYVAKNYYAPYDKINKKVESLNLKLIRLCNKRKINYIDLNSQLSKDKVLLVNLTSDGIHLNGEGYEKWKSILLPVVNLIK